MRTNQSRILSTCLVALLTPFAFAQTSPQSQTVQVELQKAIKAKNAKIGDEVKARTVTPLVINGGTVIPVGSTVMGHIVAVQPDVSGSDASSLTLSFDSVNMNHGQKLPLTFALLAAMRPGESSQQQQPQQQPDNTPAAGQAQPEMQILHGGSITPHNTPTTHNPPETPKKTPEKKDSPAVAAQKGSVIGMPGVTLEIADSSNASSTFRSAHKNLQLDSGMQFILKVIR